MDGSREIVAALKRHFPDSSEDELLDGAARLVRFFRLLIEIERERKKERHDEDQRGQHTVHKTN